MQPETPAPDQAMIMTLEAWADTIIPGEKRWPDDRAIAGVSTGGGSVAAGAIEVLQTDAEHRIALVDRLCKPGHPEKQIWVNLAVFSNMAFDTGTHLSTPEALAAGHPGLTHIGFRKPDADGIWRFPDYTYHRQLAQPHPDTTPSGSPA